MVIHGLGNSGRSGLDVLPDFYLHLQGPQCGYQWVRELRSIRSRSSAWPSSRSPRSSKWLSMGRGKDCLPLQRALKEFPPLKVLIQESKRPVHLISDGLEVTLAIRDRNWQMALPRKLLGKPKEWGPPRWHSKMSNTLSSARQPKHGRQDGRTTWGLPRNLFR